jgi:hypothetical protein
VRLYTASSEEALRARKLLTDWAGEGFLTKAQYERLEQETVFDLRTTNIFLRLILFLFTLISVGATVALFYVVFLSRASEQTTGIFFLLIAAICYAAAEVAISRARLYRYGIEERSPFAPLVFSVRECRPLFTAAFLIPRSRTEPSSWFLPPVPFSRSGSGAASGSGMHFSRQ